MTVEGLNEMKEARVQHILMVCTGNICRSPTAEAVCRVKVAQRRLNIEVDSAGTMGYHQGDKPDSRAMAAGKKRGFSFEGIRARQIIDADFEHFDLILAADKINLAELRCRCPLEYQDKLQLMLAYGDTQVSEVPDPYYGGAEGFELVLDLLGKNIDALLNNLVSSTQKQR